MNDGQATNKDLLRLTDAWANRVLKYKSAIVAIATVAMAICSGFALFVLPHVRVVVSLAWFVLSVVAVIIGFRNRDGGVGWRILFAIGAVLSIGGWGYFLTDYRIGQHKHDRPHFTVSISSGRSKEKDEQTIRQEERTLTEQRITSENRWRREQTMEVIMTWTWLLSCILWSCGLIGVMTQANPKHYVVGG